MTHWIRYALSGVGATALAGALAAGVSAATATASTTASTTTTSSRTLAPGTQFFVPQPVSAYRMQEAALLAAGKSTEAAALAQMVATPQAVWFNGGSPAQVTGQVTATVNMAQANGAVPVLVAYDIPGRDCSQFSAGGALTDADYQAWIAAFAAGIGNGKAVVILEPDSLGNMPSDCHLPAGANYPFTDQGRITDLVDAVGYLEADPSTLVYLDGTHSAWQSVGNIAQRLVEAGVQRAQGFYLDVSNYQYTSNNIAYGTWISDCIAYARASGQFGSGTGQVEPGTYQDETGFFGGCPNQYYNGGPATNWAGTAMNNYAPWNDQAPSPSNPIADTVFGITSRWASLLDPLGATATTHFVIDTSRNGEGPNPMTGGADADMVNYAGTRFDQSSAIGALQAGNWCNPPGSGLGLAPTANTGVPLVDAYLWVKTPGQSDGECDTASGVRAWDYSTYNPWNVAASAQGTFDPLWGRVDPAAGAWFGAQALQLIADANQSATAPGNEAPAP